MHLNIGDLNLKRALYGFCILGPITLALMGCGSASKKDKQTIECVSIQASLYKKLPNNSIYFKDKNSDCDVTSGAAILRDMDDAVAWIQAHGAAFGSSAVSLSNILVMGHSAGGQLGGYLANSNPNVKKAILGYGVYNMSFLVTQS